MRVDKGIFYKRQEGAHWMGSRIGNDIPVDMRKLEPGRTVAGGCIRGASTLAPDWARRLVYREPVETDIEDFVLQARKAAEAVAKAGSVC